MNHPLFPIKMSSVLLLLVVVLHMSSGDVLSDCHEQCSDEELSKVNCKLQRRCYDTLPDLHTFLGCVEPCNNLGNRCFQRCAFGTDGISRACQDRCTNSATNRHTDVYDVAEASDETEDNEEDEQEQWQINVDDARDGASDGAVAANDGNLCYNTCYDELLNEALGSLYRKKIVQEQETTVMNR